MKTFALGKSSLTTSRLAYGCWRLVEMNNGKASAEAIAQGRAAVRAAFEAGYTLFDHADIYCDGAAEKVFGQVLKEIPTLRDRLVIATKCGVRKPGDPAPDSPGRYDLSAEYIVESCEQSLRRLGVETIDLYQLHRPDYLLNPEEMAGAFMQLKLAGKVREFGVSNFRPTQVVALQKACPLPLVVHQVQISLARLDCFEDGTLDQCLAEKMTPLAWSPLGGGRFGEGATKWSAPESQQTAAVNAELDAIAKQHATTRSNVALAWLLKHPARIVPIVGSTNPARIRDSVRAADIALSRDEWYRLLLAARGERLP